MSLRTGSIILSVAAVMAGSTQRLEAQRPPPAPGVCCGPAGTCVPVQDVTICYDNGREYVIGATSCAPCSNHSSGACCLQGNVCQENYDSAACVTDGGTFVGPGSNCSGSPCVPATGACCFS